MLLCFCSYCFFSIYFWIVHFFNSFLVFQTKLSQNWPTLLVTQYCFFVNEGGNRFYLPPSCIHHWLFPRLSSSTTSGSVTNVDMFLITTWISFSIFQSERKELDKSDLPTKPFVVAEVFGSVQLKSYIIGTSLLFHIPDACLSDFSKRRYLPVYALFPTTFRHLTGALTSAVLNTIYCYTSTVSSGPRSTRTGGE